MLEPWNDASLLPPPINTAPSRVPFDAKTLQHICQNITTILSRQSPLHKEGALVSRFLYKYDKKFRNDIGYRYFKKVNTALHKYLSVNLLKDVERFKSALPNTNDEYLPTRQMLEYILVKMLTFSKILIRILVCSKQAAVFYLNRLKRGESYWMSLMPYALLSRIWSISKLLLSHSTRWYTSLHPYLQKLNLQGLPLLCDEYQLPDEIEVWLDLSNVDLFGRLEWSQKKINHIDISMDDDSDMFDNILKFVNQTNEENIEHEEDNSDIFKKLNDVDQLKISNTMNIDCGEAISRETFNILSNMKKGNVEQNHVFPTVPNAVTLLKFIDKETLLRNEKSKLSLTGHLSFMQWEVLKNSLLNVVKSSEKRKLEKKIVRIWKDKCLDYLE